MKRLTNEQLNGLTGGGWAEVVDGGCGIFGAAALLSKGAILLHPAGTLTGAACAAWAVGRWLTQ